jgi:hypothetical protein
MYLLLLLVVKYTLHTNGLMYSMVVSWSLQNGPILECETFKRIIS